MRSFPNSAADKPLNAYGPHEYADHDGTSDCKHGCGCVMGPMRSSSPPGIDPHGHCPNNPLDGERLAGDYDYENVVEGRIKELQQRARAAEEQLKAVEPGTIELSETLRETYRKLHRAEQLVKRISELIQEQSL